MWNQSYDPFGSSVLSTLIAALPLVVLLGLLARHGVRAHYAALLGLAAALAVAMAVQGMPTGMALRAAAFGAAYGLFPIGWIVLNVLFLHALASDRGLVDELRVGITRLTGDRRLQLLFVAFCFGAFFEGAAGFGTPVAVTGALLIALGFEPLEASGLSLIANTAPVAFGALGTPIVVLAAVTGLAALLHASGVAFETVKYAGVGYLLYLAWSTWRETGTLGVPEDAGGSAWRVIRTGITINLLNPKLTIFFFAFLPQFVPSGTHHEAVRMLGLSGVFMALTFVVFVGYGALAAAVREHVLSRPRLVSRIRKTFAATFVLLGGRLALESR